MELSLKLNFQKGPRNKIADIKNITRPKSIAKLKDSIQ